MYEITTKLVLFFLPLHSMLCLIQINPSFPKKLTKNHHFQLFQPSGHPRVRRNGSWIVIHEDVLNFPGWIFCYHEPFDDKIKRLKSVEVSLDLWHINNSKVILTLWTLNYVDCVPSLYWFFPCCSQSSELI